MSSAGRDTTPGAVVVLGTGAAADAAAAELAEHLRDGTRVVHVSSPAELPAAVPGAGPGSPVVVGSDAGPLDDVLASLDGTALAGARAVLVTARVRHDDVARAVDDDRLLAVLAHPWAPGTLTAEIRSVLEPHVPGRTTGDDPSGHAPGHLPHAELPASAPAAARSELLRDLELDVGAVTRRMLAAAERVLGPLPRLVLPPGVRVTHQDRAIGAVLVILRGRIALDRTTAVGDLRLHHASTGPVIGLLSLAHQPRAYFTARTTTEVEAVHLTLDQLDRALRAEPEVGSAMAAVAIRVLAGRLRRSEQMQVERIQLNRELDEERARLAEALHALEDARLSLVAQARFATLGEMAAGLAHELNNPVAALERSASHLAEDIDRVLSACPDPGPARTAMRAARARAPLSTAAERALRREVESAVGDRELARRLVTAGVPDVAAARALVAGAADLDLVEAAAGIGSAVRNLQVAAERITGLVSSLRAYARPDDEPVDGVDVHDGIEDTLRLVAHRLRGIEVERRYGTLPTIRCHPGRLDQVWTNLLVNASDSLGGAGHVEIVTDTPDPDHVRVRIIDDGPGIAPGVLPRVFEPRFTTKQGTVRYGLGLGLGLARRIVDAHGGTIGLTSEPGRTEATVVLPVSGPQEEGPR